MDKLISPIPRAGAIPKAQGPLGQAAAMFFKNRGAGIGLAMYGGLVVTQIDNLVRMVMQKKMADVHPLITIFGVFIGLSLFGFMGVIFGPLMLAMFVFCINVFKRRYLDGLPDRDLFQPGGRSGG